MIIELEVLIKKLGINEREFNDFVLYWIVTLNTRYYKVAVYGSTYDNEIIQLNINGFNQIQ
ncbi:hypothetical protein ENUP19_0083G0003 [Entamoeba nuttalli]|uniref:Uncharacterized protein n=1 Tax=Entamoeba nuttalli TaxID=412467 RepID=A0ABQ0DFJ8_9EUKA